MHRSRFPHAEERLPDQATEERLRPCLAVYRVVAGPDLNCEIVFDPREWRAAYTVVKRCPPPATPPRLGEVVAQVASLGGYFGRKHDGPPGPKALWIGLQRLPDLSSPWRPWSLLK